jgi:hypothetical protein
LKPGSARIDSASALFITTADERWGQILLRAGASEVVIADRLLADAMLGRLAAGPKPG